MFLMRSAQQPIIRNIGAMQKRGCTIGEQQFIVAISGSSYVVGPLLTMVGFAGNSPDTISIEE